MRSDGPPPPAEEHYSGLAPKLTSHLFRGLAVVLLACPTRAEQIPVTGLPVPALSAFDQSILQVMETEDIKGATVGVAKDGRILYQRGFGWRNEAESVAMPENATMRLASTSKALVRQAINKLITDGTLDGDRPVFDVGQPGGGILSLSPWPALDDPRMGQITSRHLRDMKVFWEKDYAWDSIAIYEEMGFDPDFNPPPLSIEDMTRYALGRELLLEPGADWMDRPEKLKEEYPNDNWYSNFDYNILVLVVEAITGKNFLSYLRQDLLPRNLWVPATDLFIAHPFSPIGLREPHYFSEANRPNLYDAEWPSVPMPYGGFNVEAMIGSSFIVASAAPLLVYMDNYNSRWTGNMAGSSAIVKDSAFEAGVDIVVLCNDTSASGIAAAKIAEAVDGVIDNGVSWPVQRVDGQWVDTRWTPGIGSYDRPYGSVALAHATSSSGTKLQVHSGNHPFTGVMKKKLRLNAPTGTARIGVAP